MRCNGQRGSGRPRGMHRPSMSPVRSSNVQSAPAFGCCQWNEPSSGPLCRCCSSSAAMCRGKRIAARPQWKCHKTAGASCTAAGPLGADGQDLGWAPGKAARRAPRDGSDEEWAVERTGLPPRRR
eukprot:14504944-Alexandrium_andersonii.AAC.1